MAREPLDRVGVELGTLLGEIDAAIRARFQESPARTRRRDEPRQRGDGLRRMVAAALRWVRRTPNA